MTNRRIKKNGCLHRVSELGRNFFKKKVFINFITPYERFETHVQYDSN